MTLINKDKVLYGVGKAVDVANNAADKASAYVKEKELDKKASQVVKGIGEGIMDAGEKIGDMFKGNKNSTTQK